MKKQILLLSVIVFILSACDKVKDPGVDIPKPIDQALISTVWNTISEKYEYKDSSGNTAHESNTVYENPNSKSIQYQFNKEHGVSRLDKFTNKKIFGKYEIIRENKKDYVLITWDGRSTEIEKYEVTTYTNTTMSWYNVSTLEKDLRYTENGQQQRAASRDAYIELHCPCRD